MASLRAWEPADAGVFGATNQVLDAGMGSRPSSILTVEKSSVSLCNRHFRAYGFGLQVTDRERSGLLRPESPTWNVQIQYQRHSVGTAVHLTGRVMMQKWEIDGESAERSVGRGRSSRSWHPSISQS